MLAVLHRNVCAGCQWTLRLFDLRSPVTFPHRSPRLRCKSSASSTRWRTRQHGDAYTREARIAGLKSRAAFKLLQINDKYRIFRRGMTVVDLGYAPGSWSQVAVNRCNPGGRVIGVDIIPSQPPAGVSTIQGDFLSPAIQAEVRDFVADPDRGRPKLRKSFSEQLEDLQISDESKVDNHDDDRGYIDLERHREAGDSSTSPPEAPNGGSPNAPNVLNVDVVLSDMLMSTSGTPFRDHASSMDLCTAALEFAYDTSKPGGHFVCKFYQGAEDKALERRIQRLYGKVHREKPAASRSESREGYFVGLGRKAGVSRETVFAA